MYIIHLTWACELNPLIRDLIAEPNIINGGGIGEHKGSDKGGGGGGMYCWGRGNRDIKENIVPVPDKIWERHGFSLAGIQELLSEEKIKNLEK